MIKVTKAMLHPDLQHTYPVVALMPKILRFPRLIKLLNWFGARSKKSLNLEGVDCEQIEIPRAEGGHRSIRNLVFRPEAIKDSTEKLPLLFYIHGGGYILGKPEDFLESIRKFLAERPCVVVAPDYRKALTDPFPAGFNDCYDSLLWAKNNAESLNIDADKIAVAGHSAGGGLTAAVTLKARDTGDVNLAFQMPIYPMIDDTQPDDPDRAISSPIWDTRMNRLGWGAYLSGLRERGEAIPAYAAPTRNDDYSNFPPTITFVGTLEPFYWETAEYVAALREAGVEVVYEEFEDCFHGFDAIGDAEISKRARDFTYKGFARFYDRYFLGMD